LIPWTFHVLVIKSAIKFKKNVVTTSYVNPFMRELDQEAKNAGITVLNEIGVDPGYFLASGLAFATPFFNSFSFLLII